MEIKHNVKDRINGCPFGQKCDDCNLYKPLYKTGDKGAVTQEWDCQWNNIAMLMSETKDRTLGVQKAVESNRNETVKRQDQFLELAHNRAIALEKR